MTVYSKETALFDTGALGSAIDEAGETASKFLSVDSSGIMVYDGSNGAQTPSTATSGTKNVFIDDDSMEVRDGTNPLASFSYGLLDRYTQGTIITGNPNAHGIGLKRSPDEDYPSLYIYDLVGTSFISFGGINSFSPEPSMVASSTSSNITIHGGDAMTTVPFDDIEWENQNRFGENDRLMSLSSGSVLINGFDGVAMEIAASVYVIPSQALPIKIYLFHNNTEIASGYSYVSTSGGTVEIAPRVVPLVYANDTFTLKVRLLASSSSSTATVRCADKDTRIHTKMI